MFFALEKHPEVKIVRTGPRWGGWDEKASLKQNIERLMPDADVVFMWRPFGIVEFGGFRGADERIDQLKVSAYQDSPVKGAIEAKNAGLDLLFYHDHWDRQFFQDCGVRSVYLPLAVNLDLFGEWGNNQEGRSTPILLTGNTQQQTYPLRYRYERILRHKRGIQGRIRPMPGYRMKSLDHVMQEQKRYVRSLCNSRISIVTSCPHIPLTLRKYFESMAAGCVLVGDVPHSPPDDVKSCINVVSMKMSDAELVATANRLVNDPKECERQRQRNRKIAENYSYTEFAKRWVSAVKESLASR